MSGSHSGVGQRKENPPWLATVNVRVRSVYVAQRLFDSVPTGFEDEPFVLPSPQLRPRHGKSKLEGHIESWRRRVPLVQFDPREVVKGVSAASHHVEEAVQSSLATRDLGRRVGNQPEAAQAGDEGKIQILVLLVIRDVDESCVTSGTEPAVPAARETLEASGGDVLLYRRDRDRLARRLAVCLSTMDWTNFSSSARRFLLTPTSLATLEIEG